MEKSMANEIHGFLIQVKRGVEGVKTEVLRNGMVILRIEGDGVIIEFVSPSANELCSRLCEIVGEIKAKAHLADCEAVTWCDGCET